MQGKVNKIIFVLIYKIIKLSYPCDWSLTRNVTKKIRQVDAGLLQRYEIESKTKGLDHRNKT